MSKTTEPSAALQPEQGEPISGEDLDVINECHRLELEAWRKAGYDEGVAAATAASRDASKSRATLDGAALACSQAFGSAQGGEFGDEDDLVVIVHRYIDIEGFDRGTQLTAANARELGQSLLKAADALEG